VEIFVFLLIVGLIFGAVGVAIASNKNVDGLAGFLLGAFLGPIGLIIVALLNPSTAVTSSAADAVKPEKGIDEFVGEINLTSDPYRLWLADRYEIQRNELFDRFVIKDQTFDTLDAALACAYDLEAARIESARLDNERLLAERSARLEAKRIANERAAADWERDKPKAILALVISASVLAAFFMWAYIKAGEIEVQKTKAAAELLTKFEREFGVEVPENAINVELKADAGYEYRFWCEGAKNGKVLSFYSASSPEEIAGSFTKQLGSGEPMYGSLFDTGENFNTIWKKKDASYVLTIVELQKTNSSVNLCVVKN
jgi:hypothetical protein